MKKFQSWKSLSTTAIAFTGIVILLDLPFWLMDLDPYIYRQHVARTYSVIVLLTTLWLGCRKLTQRHPVFQSNLSRWLRTLPYDEKDILPLGKLGLCREDVFTIIVLTGCLWLRPTVPLWSVGVTYLLAYCLTWLSVYFVQELWQPFYLLAFLLVAALGWIVSTSIAMLVCLVVGVLLTQLCLPRSIHACRQREFHTDVMLPWQDLQSRCDRIRVGSPFRELAPECKRLVVGIPYLNALLSAWLVFWISLNLVKGRSAGFEDASIVIVFIVLGHGSVLSVRRISDYYTGLRSPLSVGGRLATGRLIIPRFDLGFVAPMTIMGMTIIVASLIFRLPRPEVVAAIAVGVQHLVAAYFGPDWFTFRMTAPARLVRMDSPQQPGQNVPGCMHETTLE